MEWQLSFTRGRPQVLSANRWKKELSNRGPTFARAKDSWCKQTQVALAKTASEAASDNRHPQREVPELSTYPLISLAESEGDPQGQTDSVFDYRNPFRMELSKLR